MQQQQQFQQTRLDAEMPVQATATLLVAIAGAL
jgi:hypothetical protein